MRDWEGQGLVNYWLMLKMQRMVMMSLSRATQD